MRNSTEPDFLVVFPSRLGWVALVGAADVLRQLSFGYRSPLAAASACDPELVANARRGTWNEPLVRRIQAYACGGPDDFRDVRVDPGPLTEFRRRVLRRCRQIPYGRTVSYGQLAAEVGSPGAARAVGNCLAANRIPLVVPCHRVLRADGRLGAYSAPGGTRTKKRLLALEGLRFH